MFLYSLFCIVEIEWSVPCLLFMIIQYTTQYHGHTTFSNTVLYSPPPHTHTHTHTHNIHPTGLPIDISHFRKQQEGGARRTSLWWNPSLLSSELRWSSARLKAAATARMCLRRKCLMPGSSRSTAPSGHPSTTVQVTGCIALITALLYDCRITEIVLNVFISRINGELAHPSACRKWEQDAFFNNQCDLFFFLLFFCQHSGQVFTCVTFCDW